MTLRILLLIGLLLIAGCSTKGSVRDDLPEPPRPSQFKTDVGFSKAWSYSALELVPRRGFAMNAAVDPERVFVAGNDGRVAALDRSSGKPLWRIDLKRPLSAGPAVAGELLVIGGSDGQVLGLNAADGSLLWRSGVTSEVLAQPQIGGGLVIVRTLDGRVFGLEAASGKRRWLFEQSVPVLTLRGLSAPILVPGQVVVVGLDSGKLVVLDPESGRQGWEVTIGEPSGRSDIERMVDIDADPVLYRSDIYVVGYQGRLAAVEPTGRIKWQREMSAYAGLAVDATQVYVTDAEQRVWAVDRFSGAAVWRQDELRGLRLTGPARAGDYLIVGDDQGYLNWLSIQDGSLQRRQKIGGAFVAVPKVAGNEIFLLTEDGLTVLR